MGTSKIYVNGSVVASLENIGSTWRQPIEVRCPCVVPCSPTAKQPGGVLHFGQEADSPWSSFDELQSLDALIDELRVWSRIRSDDEIMRDYLRTPQFDESLVLHYDFDELETDARGRHIIRDRSGHGESCALSPVLE